MLPLAEMFQGVKQRCPAVILAEAGKLAHETASAPLYADNGIV